MTFSLALLIGTEILIFSMDSVYPSLQSSWLFLIRCNCIQQMNLRQKQCRDFGTSFLLYSNEELFRKIPRNDYIQ